MSTSALSEVRERRGISQLQLEQASGVSERTIRRIETDPDYSPGSATLIRLARALGVSLDSLFDHAPEPITSSTGRGKPNGLDTAAVGGSAEPAHRGA